MAEQISPVDAPDWEYIRHGSVTLFRSTEILTNAVSRLTAFGYRLRKIDCSTPEQMIFGFAEALNWELNFGYIPKDLNLNAFNDAMSLATDTKNPKTLLVLEHFEKFHALHPEIANEVLDIMDSSARTSLIFGERLVIFVHCNDPYIELKEIGCTTPTWNYGEFLIAARDPKL